MITEPEQDRDCVCGRSKEAHSYPFLKGYRGCPGGYRPKPSRPAEPEQDREMIKPAERDGCMFETCPRLADHEQCCSSHGKPMCHAHYKRTHFVEVCGCGRPECSTQTGPFASRPVVPERSRVGRQARPSLDRLFDALYAALHGDRQVSALERESVAQLAESVAAELDRSAAVEREGIDTQPETRLQVVRRAINDPWQFTKRDQVGSCIEPLGTWQARAVLVALEADHA